MRKLLFACAFAFVATLLHRALRVADRALAISTFALGLSLVPRIRSAALRLPPPCTSGLRSIVGGRSAGAIGRVDSARQLHRTLKIQRQRPRSSGACTFLKGRRQKFPIRWKASRTSSICSTKSWSIWTAFRLPVRNSGLPHEMHHRSSLVVFVGFRAFVGFVRDIAPKSFSV